MRIGVLGNEGSWYVNQLCAAAEARGHETHPLQFTQLQATVLSGNVNFHIGDTDVTSLDALIVRTMPPGSLEQVVSRMDFLAGIAAQGIPVVNDPKAIECAVDKYLTTQKLAGAGISVPDTIVCENSESAMAAFEQLGSDVVVKPLFGAEGRGILRVSDPEIAMRAFRTLERLNASLYLQRFNTGPNEDIRILLLDGQLIGSMKRFPKNGDFRANAAQQGTSISWTPSDAEMQIAMEAADVTGCVFSGIDLMYNADGEPVVIEVNAVPGWRSLQQTCGLNVPERIYEWLESKLA